VLKALGWTVRKVAGLLLSASRARVLEPCQVSDPVGRGSRIGGGDDRPRGHIIRVGSKGIPSACRGASKTVAVGTGIGLSPDRDPSKPDKDLSRYPRLAAAKTWLQRMLKSSRNPFSYWGQPRCCGYIRSGTPTDSSMRPCRWRHWWPWRWCSRVAPCWASCACRPVGGSGHFARAGLGRPRLA